MTKEQLEKVLRSHKNIEVEGWIDPDEYGFSRKIAFTIRGVRYVIVWYCNLSYLYCGELRVVDFARVRLDSTYPDGYKLSLYMENEYGNVIALIPVEEYEN